MTVPWLTCIVSATVCRQFDDGFCALRSRLGARKTPGNPDQMPEIGAQALLVHLLPIKDGV